jgi:hypothetical protein
MLPVKPLSGRKSGQCQQMQIEMLVTHKHLRKFSFESLVVGAPNRCCLIHVTRKTIKLLQTFGLKAGS